jgi:adenosylcobinamide-phosphate synthase
MALFSLIAALLIEQWRPLSDRRYLFTLADQYATYFERQFNAGQKQHGLIAWLVAILPLVLGSWLLYAILAYMNPLLALAFNVAALYLTMGFRQFSHFFTGIQLALREGELQRARELLGAWRGHDCGDMPEEQIVKLALEEALAASHRNVFAVVFWFVLLPGPSGALLYRMSHYLDHRWGRPQSPEMGDFGEFARRAFWALDWLPVRLTASTFAIVGDFEDAIFCWRTQARSWMDAAMGIVIAAGAGAMGVKLGNPYLHGGELQERPELGLGDEPDAAHLDSAVGLLWRALVLWLVILFMLGVASIFR